MWDKNQKTLKSQINFSGIGLHSGKNADVKIDPAEADIGVVFKRTDLKENNEIHANFKNVSSAKLCTKIQNNFGVSVSTIEHLMAAFYICGIDNGLVKINGPEIPIMDGSAKDFVEMIKKSGFKTLNKKRKFLKISRRVNLEESGRSISIKPANNTFDVSFTLSYDNPLIKTQSNKTSFQENNLESIYVARTFCLHEDVEKIKSAGLAKGGSLDNAIVVKGDKILNKEGLRSNKEFVNHKILDLAGDFMLAGMRVIGSVDCIHGGHELTNNFLRKVFSDRANFEITENPAASLNVRKIASIQKRLAVNA